MSRVRIGRIRIVLDVEQGDGATSGNQIAS